MIASPQQACARVLSAEIKLEKASHRRGQYRCAQELEPIAMESSARLVRNVSCCPHRQDARKDLIPLLRSVSEQPSSGNGQVDRPVPRPRHGRERSSKRYTSPVGGATLSALCAKYRPLIRRQALALLRNESDSEDATQDVLLRMTRALAGFERRSRLSTWVYRITFNTCMTHLERRRRWQQRWATYSSYQLEDSAATESVGPVDQLEQVESRQVVREAVSRLPLR